MRATGHFGSDDQRSAMSITPIAMCAAMKASKKNDVYGV
jgi:hypothetical protein